MYSTSVYLLSGAVSVSTGSASCLGMDKFAVSVRSDSFGANIATGTIRIEGRLDQSEPYIPIFTTAFNSNTGVIARFDGPLESIRAVLSPLSTGTYTAVVRYAGFSK